MQHQDLFESLETLPAEVQSIVEQIAHDLECGDECGYEVLKNGLSQLEMHGYTYDYGLDAVPYNLRRK